MKAAKILKKIDLRILQKLAMILIAGIFVYIFYYYYGLFADYRAVKKSKAGGGVGVERKIILPPTFFNFTPGEDDEAGIDKYRLFTFKEKKAGADGSSANGGAGAGENNYLVLGVVKKDKLFLVVQFKSDDTIRLFSEGMAIDDNSRVKRVTPQQVVIADSAGGEHSHKIFQFEGVKEIDLEKMKIKKKEENHRKPNSGAKDDVDDN